MMTATDDETTDAFTCDSCGEENGQSRARWCATCEHHVCATCYGEPFCAECRRTEPSGLRVRGPISIEALRYPSLPDEHELFGTPRRWAFWEETGDSEGMAAAREFSSEAFCDLLRDNDRLDGVRARTWDRWRAIVREQYDKPTCLYCDGDLLASRERAWRSHERCSWERAQQLAQSETDDARRERILLDLPEAL